ncbi:MAG: hypothetical protein LQ342_007605 [Letrouitia transgressa]|nr:MAG: hypothetical protein LQ342_007605 [Letrouitia transgressa]
MAAIETFMKLLNDTHSTNSGLEQRIAALESQLQGLLKWQQSSGASKKKAQAATKAAKELPVSKTAVEKDPVVTVKEILLTPPTTPGSETPPLVEEEQTIIPASLPKEDLAQAETDPTQLAYQILDVIQHYGQHLDNGDQTAASAPWAGRAKFAPKVETFVVSKRPIQFILPSFPWKSVSHITASLQTVTNIQKINRIDKVTGARPDFGEELALARLDNLCRDIAKIYEFGAEVTIATDGLVFNDIVGISDDDTWNYSAELMDMAKEKGFCNIKLLRVMDLLGYTQGEELTKERYLETVNDCRKELAAQFGNADEAVAQMIKDDPDTLLTYRGFIRFLETDLRYSPIIKKGISGNQYRKAVKEVAKGMMNRAESFTKIILAKCPDYVRLSIHPSSGTVKLSIPLIPQTNGSFPKSPWHSSIAVGIDGSYTTVHSKDVRESHIPIIRDGRPYFFREKSELYDWCDQNVETEHLYPCGLLVRPKNGSEEAIRLDEDGIEKLQQLARLQPSVTVKGFANIADGNVEPRAADSA